MNKLVIIIYKMLFTLQLFGVHSLCNGQDTYVEQISFNHDNATTQRPKFYNQTVHPKNGYYAIKVDYNHNGRPTCGWCYPNDRGQGTPRINAYGESVTLATKCDGGPCKFTYTISYKKYNFDESIIKITKDPEENLSSCIWAENKSNQTVELVYKAETYDPGSTTYRSKVTSIKIPGYSKIRVMPRFRRIDTTLQEDFMTPIYMK